MALNPDHVPIARPRSRSENDALMMASANPAELLGVASEFGSIEIGRSADLILFRWDAENATLDVAATVVGGEPVYVKESFMSQ